MKLLGSIEKRIIKDRNGENIPQLEITGLILVHSNLVNNTYQQDSRVLYTFISNKSFGESLEISPSKFIFEIHLIQEFHVLQYVVQIKILNY